MPLGNGLRHAGLMETIHDSFRRQGLVRPRDGRFFAGVCAGLARRTGMNPWAARLLFVLLLLVIPGSQILVYPILWILMPKEAAPVVPPPAPIAPQEPLASAAPYPERTVPYGRA
jgi:phage shock protein C